tara:strand:+ start:2705 stop:3352 length:648 start_codon:yes stop_codon:yes gene_type:complete
MENENPNQGSAHTEAQVSDQASETVTENVSTESKSGNIPSYEWHRRILGESKKAKSELAEARQRLEAYEQKEMEAQGKHQDLINALRDENQKLKAGISERDQVYTWSKRSEALRHVANQNGCIHSDHLLRLMDESVLQQIEVDDHYNPVAEDVQRVVESFKGNPEYQYLFRSKAPSVDTVTPNSKAQKKESKKISEMSSDEIAKILANPSMIKDL